MSEHVDPNLNEITAANDLAFEKAREIVGEFKAVLEHEVLIDDSIQKIVEINPPL